MSYNGKPDIEIDFLMANNGFWCDLQVKKYLDSYRLSHTFSQEILKNRIQISIIKINSQLLEVEGKIKELGFPTLKNYNFSNSEKIGDEEVLVIQYERAVFSYAKSLMLRMIPATSQREIANNPILSETDTEIYWLNESKLAVQSFLDFFMIDENGDVPLAESNFSVALL